MLPVERYLLLFQRFAGPQGVPTQSEVSLEELADALFCTSRNVKIILRRLEDEGWIHWQAGRGRGNRSKMTFLTDRETLLLERSEQLAQKGEYKQAFELLQSYGEGTRAKERFLEWLNSHFGYRTEQLDGNKESDTLRLPVYRPILYLDPAETFYAFDAHMVRQLFDQLVQFDPEAGKIIPALAHAWDSNEEATLWTFYLRKGVYFHHGRELTADDVVFTFERLRNNKTNSWILRSLLRIEAAGPRKVRMYLSKPNRIFLRYLCSASLSILPEELVRHNEAEFWRNPVGTGPFRILEWKESRFVMEANRFYYKGRAHLDKVVIVVMPEDTAPVQVTMRKQLLIDHDRRDMSVEQDWNMIEKISQGCTLLTWNLGKEGPQHSPAFRKAINYIIDRSSMIRELGEDRVYPAQGFLPNDESPYWQDAFDPEAAKQLLQEAGYDGTPIKLHTYNKYALDAQWVVQRCAEFGIRVELHVTDWLSIRNPQFIRDADCILYCVILAEDEVCLLETYEQDGSFVKEHLDPGLRQWIGEQIDWALACGTAADRWKRFGEIETRLREETQIMFLVHKKFNMYFHPTLKGVGVNSHGWIDFKDIWLENGGEKTDNS